MQILTFVQPSKVFSILEKPAIGCSSHSVSVKSQNSKHKILQGYKLRLAEQWDFKLKFPDPRPFIQKHGLAPTPFPVPLMGKDRSEKIQSLQVNSRMHWTTNETYTIYY